MEPLLRVISLVFLLLARLRMLPMRRNLQKRKMLPKAARDLDSAPAESRLPCYFDLHGGLTWTFLFRYSTGFQIDCQLGSTVLPGTTWMAVIRITNQFGKSAIMLEEFDIPQVPHENHTALDAPLSGLKVSMSGGFAAGPGRYLFEIVLTDKRGNSIRRKWKLKLPGYKEEQQVSSALLPGAIAPLLAPRWDGALTSKGIRVTVLLDLESLYPFAWLRTWDRAYLLQSLTSLLDQLPCKSVRLIAFDLERQEELFRQDNFDADGFERLEKALGQVQFDTIPYQSLMRGAWAGFLVNLTQQEITTKQTPDAVIFLGISGNQAEAKFPSEMLNKLETQDTHIYYLRYLNLGVTCPLKTLPVETGVLS